MRDGNDYSDRLVDPRWQRLRLEVFQRDGFACRACGETALELHAHHSYYERAREPWQYPSESIVTYCHRCHEAEHGRSFAGDAAVLQLLRQAGFPLMEDRLTMAGAIRGDGEPLTPKQARELAFIVAVLVWRKAETWAAMLDICETAEAAVPRWSELLPPSHDHRV